MGENKRDGGQNPNSAQPSSHTQAGGIRDCRPAQIDINQLDQLSPCSPPSFGDIKGSDNESNDQGGELVSIWQLLRPVYLFCVHMDFLF